MHAYGLTKMPNIISSITIGLPILFVVNLLAVGFVTAQSSNNQTRIDSLEALLEQQKSLNKEKVDLLNSLGYEYWIIDPEQSQTYGAEALEIAKILPYEKGVAFANRVIGVSHWVRGNIDLSFKYLLDSESLYKSIGDSLGMANSMLNLGMAYADQLNFDKASEKYRRALELFISLERSSRIATTYTKMADLLIQGETYREAYDYLTKALDIHQRNDFLYGIAEVNGKLGKIAIAREELNNAISYLLLAVDAATQRNDHVGLADYFHSIGLCFFRKNDFAQAAAYLSQSQRLAEKHDLKKILREVYHTFKELKVAQREFQAAVTYYDKYLAVRDELFNEEKSNIIANMEAKRAFDEKEQQLHIAQKHLELLKQQNKTNQAVKLALLLGLLTIIAIAWGLLQRKNRKLIQKQKDLRQAKKQTDELKDTIKSKEQELTSYTFNFVQKNQLISELKTSVEKLKSEVGREHRSKLDGLVRKINPILTLDEDWKDFRKHFESVHPNLIGKLNQRYPNLTKNEFKLIALLRLNLSSKEISSVLGISPDSVKTARYRLRKKLDLDNQTDLFDFLIQLDKM